MKVWAYIQPNTNILCCALLKESVPEGVNAIELEVETPNDVILDNGEIGLKTDAEKLQEVKQSKLSRLKSYTATLLAPTDYIITKIAEAQLLDNTNQVEALRQKYSSSSSKEKILEFGVKK
jgi:regulator of PEP synthase PpsR (kinase-PPPase family)